MADESNLDNEALTSTPFSSSFMAILSFTVATSIAIVTFFVRIPFPSNETLPTAFNFKLGYFTQYVVYFCLGCIARRYNALFRIPSFYGRMTLPLGFIFGIVGFVAMAAMVGAFSGVPIDDITIVISGGWHWQSVIYSLWGEWTAALLCPGLIIFFQE